MRHKGLLITVAVAAAAWLALSAAIGIHAMEGALHPYRRPLTQSAEASAGEAALRNHARFSEAEVTAEDGVRLRAWSMRPDTGNGDAVILLHGVGGNRDAMIGAAEILLRNGYAVLLPDARAQGASGGQIATYGDRESGDVRRWFEWLRRTEAPHCIDGLGDSMGAALILDALEKEPSFCAVVAESPFASFREAAYDRLGQWSGTGLWLGHTLLYPAIPAGLLYARLRYGADLDRVSPETVVAGTHVPVLLIHGLADTNLPPRHSELIRSRNRLVELWEPAGVRHCGTRMVEPAEYERRIVGWFRRHDSLAVAALPR